MRTVTVDDAESFGFGGGVDHRTLEGALGATDVAINRYRLDAHTRLPWGLHAHYDQEEIFLVTTGVVTFDTLEGRVRVPAGGAIRFDPGEYQCGFNDADTPASFFAIGAPADSDDVRVPLPCPSCDGDELLIEYGRDDLVCPACGEAVATTCPVCGEDNREVRLDDAGSRLVDSCRACGDSQPIRSIDDG